MKRRIGDFLLENGKPWTQAVTQPSTGKPALCAKRWCKTADGQFGWELVPVTAVRDELIKAMQVTTYGAAININRTQIDGGYDRFGQIEFERELATTDPMLSLWPPSSMQDDASAVAVAASSEPARPAQWEPARIAYASLTPAEIQAAEARAAAIGEEIKTQRIRESWATVVSRHTATAEVKPSAWDTVVARHRSKAA